MNQTIPIEPVEQKRMTFTMPVEFKMEVTNDICLQNSARLSDFKSVDVSLPVYFH